MAHLLATVQTDEQRPCVGAGKINGRVEAAALGRTAGWGQKLFAYVFYVPITAFLPHGHVGPDLAGRWLDPGCECERSATCNRVFFVYMIGLCSEENLAPLR